MTPARPHRAALLISYSDIRTDPRLRRQIDWLTADGWTIDTIGLGEHPADEVRTHTRLHEPTWWMRTRAGQAVTYLLLPARSIFRAVTQSRIPDAGLEPIRRDEYGLVVFNEYEFMPLAADPAVFGSSTAHLHLDMHEYREDERHPGTLWARLTKRYFRWIRSFIAHPAFATRSTVAPGIARLYEGEFGFAPMTIIRNAPAFVDQGPSDVAEDRVRMLFHGMASWERGFTEILGALGALDDRFTMTFMLAPPQHVIDELQVAIDAAGLSDRARIVPPSPMREIARNINAFDLEIVFYPPVSTNVELALPNKVFEAVQGRLGLVIGHSPSLEEIVRTYGNGVVVDGWAAADLRDVLAGLTADDIRGLKKAAHDAAADLNAENEGRRFLAALGLDRAATEDAS